MGVGRESCVRRFNRSLETSSLGEMRAVGAAYCSNSTVRSLMQTPCAPLTATGLAACSSFLLQKKRRGRYAVRAGRVSLLSNEEVLLGARVRLAPDTVVLLPSVRAQAPTLSTVSRFVSFATPNECPPSLHFTHTLYYTAAVKAPRCSPDDPDCDLAPPLTGLLRTASLDRPVRPSIHHTQREGSRHRLRTELHRALVVASHCTALHYTHNGLKGGSRSWQQWER